jgi:hypothetical protein
MYYALIIEEYDVVKVIGIVVSIVGHIRVRQISNDI